MARETKAQREAREHAAMVERNAELDRTYPQRLMELLERATNANFALKVESGCFVVEDRDARGQEYFLGLVWNAHNEDVLERLEFEVGYKEDREREAQRKFLAKQAALAKLSAEERQLLGL